MTKSQITAAVASILTTLAETREGWAPSGHLYMALQTADAEVYTLDAYQRILAGMGDWVELEGAEVVRITPAGREMARKIEEALRVARGA